MVLYLMGLVLEFHCEAYCLNLVKRHFKKTIIRKYPISILLKFLKLCYGY